MVRAVSAGTQNTNNKFMKKKSKSLLNYDTKVSVFHRNLVTYVLSFGYTMITFKIYAYIRHMNVKVS